jgi:mannose-1-phosphate guanylyltransferase/mannose-6-phosphate isomerase
MTNTIHPVLLCGGSGRRLWPLSRKSYPKQFVQLVGEESLFQASARRLSGAGFAAPSVVTAADFRFVVIEQLATLEIAPADILIEPAAKNTAAAICAAARFREAVAAAVPATMGGAACHLRHPPRPARDRLWLAGADRRARGGFCPRAAAAQRLRRKARSCHRRTAARRRAAPLERGHLPILHDGNP